MAAVPFLAALAAARIQTSGVLSALGTIAESTDTRALSEPDQARHAVAAQIDVLAPLTDHDVAGIRSTAIFALSRTGPADRYVPLLVQRWAAETDPEMRAGVLDALAFQTPTLALEKIAESALGEGHPALVRLSAALAVARCEGVWNTRAEEAATAWISTPTCP